MQDYFNLDASQVEALVTECRRNGGRAAFSIGADTPTATATAQTMTASDGRLMGVLTLQIIVHGYTVTMWAYQWEREAGVTDTRGGNTSAPIYCNTESAAQEMAATMRRQGGEPVIFDIDKWETLQPTPPGTELWQRAFDNINRTDLWNE